MPLRQLFFFYFMLSNFCYAPNGDSFEQQSVAIRKNIEEAEDQERFNIKDDFIGKMSAHISYELFKLKKQEDSFLEQQKILQRQQELLSLKKDRYLKEIDRLESL